MKQRPAWCLNYAGKYGGGTDVRYTAPGVYAVICTASGTAYVGSSGNCDRRLREHLDSLRGQRNNIRALQAEWNRHGELYFEFKVLERADPKTLKQREQHWIEVMGTLNRRRAA